jgi:hypothetical protein
VSASLENAVKIDIQIEEAVLVAGDGASAPRLPAAFQAAFPASGKMFFVS